MKSIDLLKPYPFQRLKALFEQTQPAQGLRPINLSIGEPKHPTPALIRDAIAQNLDGLSVYPGTQGTPELRACLAAWLNRRFHVKVDADTQVLPVLGSREALFAFAQVVLDDASQDDWVAFPNPFYQIYEGASFLGGAKPFYLNIQEKTGLPDWQSLDAATLEKIKLLYVCSPNNPTGSVIKQHEWETLFSWADQYDFVIASDECYSEIYLDEGNPPMGALEAAFKLGRTDFKNLVVFSSLSKRSNAPGLRSGLVAGDAGWLAKFLKYRTYHGSAMSTMVQAASVAAWSDEEHVRENRAQYKNKFDQVLPILSEVFSVERPEAGFYIWLKVGGNDQEFACKLLQQQNVTVLPGSFLGRDTAQGNPGEGFLRIALVAPLDDCVEAAHRIVALAKTNL